MTEFQTVELASSRPFTTSSPGYPGQSFPDDPMLFAQGVGLVPAPAMERTSVGYTHDVFLTEKFRSLVDQWRTETRYISSLSEIEEHEAFAKIIGLGGPVISLVLNELVENPSWLLLALDALVDNPPISENSTGGLLDSTNAWIEWGKEKGYLATMT